MSDRVPVVVVTSDPISRAGIGAQLRTRPGLVTVEHPPEAAVAVVVGDTVDVEVARDIREHHRTGGRRVVVVVSRLDDGALLTAVEAGASGILLRSEATPDALERTVVTAASGDGSMSPDLLGRLIRQVGRLQSDVLSPRGLSFTGLTDRETEVLRLVADGHDTSEVASQLHYSERTVKNVIHDVTVRLNLRNRTHAVAYALRGGFI